MTIKKHIPNLVTLLNLWSGCIAVIYAVHNSFIMAAVFTFLGIFFDFFDGLLARKLKVQGPLGVQLDSLADMVTSGLVPGVIMYKLLLMSSDAPPIATVQEWNAPVDVYIPAFAFLGFLITLASAFRLARFNLDEDQQTYFKGLPTPANALFILSLPLIIEFQNGTLITNLILNTWFLIAVIVFSCVMLNVNTKLLSLKFSSFGFKANLYRYLLILGAIVLIIVLKFSAIPLIILYYILISILKQVITNSI